MGGPSLEVLQIGRVLTNLYTPRSIDLGGGTGRNSIHLAASGFDAMVVEKDRGLCSDATRAASDRGVVLEVQESDVLQYEPSKQYDLVLLLGILHFLPLEDASRLIALYRQCTTSSGVHIVTISPQSDESGTTNPLLGQGYLGSMTRSTVELAYDGWIKLSYERYSKTDDHLGGSLDVHAIEKFVFVPNHRSIVGRTVNQFLLRSQGNLDKRLDELPVHLRHRESKLRFEKLYGEPDHVFVETGSHKDFGLTRREYGDFEICVAFWGRVKCYFENDAFVGFARYESDTFFVFE